MGWDVGDKFTDVCVGRPDGAIVDQQRVHTTKHSLEKQLTRYPGALVVLEVGVHSRWISDLVSCAGHAVIVANARQVQLIYKRKSKTDRSDALLLARLGRFDPALLAPVHHRTRSAQLDLACLRARDVLVSARTDLINHVRGILKPFGVRVPDCGSGAFVRHAEKVLPPELTPALAPVLACLRALEAELLRYEKQVEHLATVSYPETTRVSQVSGVGPITAARIRAHDRRRQPLHREPNRGPFRGAHTSERPVRGIRSGEAHQRGGGSGPGRNHAQEQIVGGQ